MEIWFMFVIPSGGMHTLNCERIPALTKTGIRCRLIYFQQGIGSTQGTMPCPVHYANKPEEFKELLRQHPPSAIVVSSWYTKVYTLREVGYAGPIIFEIQGLGPPQKAREEMSKMYGYIQPHATAVLHPGSPLITSLLSVMMPHKVSYVIPNPINADAFHYRSKPMDRKLPMVLIWIGRVEPNKNWAEFLLIAHELVRRGEDPELWMFEDPTLSEQKDRQAMAGAIHALGLQNRIKLLPHVPRMQMAEYFSAAADAGGVLLMTSLSEGAPYAALEAMICRCPIVTSDNDGIRTMVANGVHGIYYNLGDIAGAANAVQNLRHDKKLRKAIVSQAEQRVLSEFQPANYAAAFRLILNQLGVR
ncbi:glycosyltransferase [Paenibacillus sp. PR3]|uniref:Glycosyltransferase n=1 Tax=Paenibacillus terricola TaxID=2763503 RepID=A0ABR8MVN5_9BACL|nr:glycosyltransferase [Paenibacillus terricola]MBD3920030.1 glycosyltransferase [Paenibacillus terricola]